MGHGGPRPGSGRPVGGVSQTRRLITGAIQQGLAQAGRKRFPDRVSQEDDELAAIQTGAMIVDDMIQSGQGNDVMKLWATVALKEGSEEKDPTTNTLATALARLPKAKSVMSHDADMAKMTQKPLEAAPLQGGTTHQEGVVPPNTPYFLPQTALPLPDPHAPEDQ